MPFKSDRQRKAVMAKVKYIKYKMRPSLNALSKTLAEKGIIMTESDANKLQKLMDDVAKRKLLEG